MVSEGTPRRNWRRRIKDGVSYAASKKVKKFTKAIQPSNIGKNVYKVAKKDSFYRSTCTYKRRCGSSSYSSCWNCSRCGSRCFWR